MEICTPSLRDCEEVMVGSAEEVMDMLWGRKRIAVFVCRAEDLRKAGIIDLEQVLKKYQLEVLNDVYGGVAMVTISCGRETCTVGYWAASDCTPDYEENVSIDEAEELVEKLLALEKGVAQQ